MDIPAAVAAELATISAALNDPGEDVENSLRQLGESVRAAIDSYLGLTMATSAGGQPVAITMTEATTPADPVMSSLRIPLQLISSGGPNDWLILYASRPGAFVDFAADVSWALAIEAGAVILDDDLLVDLTRSTAIGFAEMSLINQGIGVLIEAGYPLDEAPLELARRAEASHQPAHEVASALLRRLSEPGPLI